jgi:hypothetical protein
MKNLKTYQQLFESAKDDLGYGLDDVRKLPMYKALLALGWEDISTDRGENNMTIKLKHPKHGDYKYLTVQANGQVRTYFRGNYYPWITYKMRPKIMRKPGDLYKNVSDWNEPLLYLLSWTYKTMGMGLNLKGIKKKIGGWKSGSEYSIPDDILIDLLEHMFKEGDPEIFLSVYSNSDDDVKEKIAKRLNMDDDKINKIMNTKISVGAAMKFA